MLKGFGGGLVEVRSFGLHLCKLFSEGQREGILAAESYLETIPRRLSLASTFDWW